MAPRQRLSPQGTSDVYPSESSTLSKEDRRVATKKTSTLYQTEADIARDRHDYFNVGALVRFFWWESRGRKGISASLISGRNDTSGPDKCNDPCHSLLFSYSFFTSHSIYLCVRSSFQPFIIGTTLLNYDLSQVLRFDISWTGGHFWVYWAVRIMNNDLSFGAKSDV
jgi:hypothetical protein